VSTREKKKELKKRIGVPIEGERKTLEKSDYDFGKSKGRMGRRGWKRTK